jgi:hypothetical protein
MSCHENCGIMVHKSSLGTLIEVCLQHIPFRDEDVEAVTISSSSVAVYSAYLSSTIKS